MKHVIPQDYYIAIALGFCLALYGCGGEGGRSDIIIMAPAPPPVTPPPTTTPPVVVTPPPPVVVTPPPPPAPPPAPPPPVVVTPPPPAPPPAPPPPVVVTPPPAPPPPVVVTPPPAPPPAAPIPFPRVAPAPAILNMPESVDFEDRKRGFESSGEYTVRYTVRRSDDGVGTNHTDAHLSRINAAAAYARGATGSGEKILVVDTGIRTSHREFSGVGKLASVAFDPSSSYSPTLDSPNSRHGTAVAATAAGNRALASGLNMQGVAFDASIQFAYLALGTSDGIYRLFDLQTFTTASDTRQAAFYNRIITLAETSGSAIANLSFGFSTPISNYAADEVRRRFSQTAAVLAQAGTTAANRVILVLAAGNNGSLRFPGSATAPGAAAPKDSPNVISGFGAVFPELQSHMLAVVALDQDGTIAIYSNRCGIAKAFCLAAPGSRILTATYTGDDKYSPIDGTSFSAPIISGSLAVLREYFRGQLGNTEVVQRLLATANRTGIYNDSDVYGHGLVDLDAATRPVGVVITGLSQHAAPIALSGLVAPAAYGGAIQQGLRGIEIAGFDALGHPFWYPVSALVQSQRDYSFLAHRLAQPLAEQSALVPFLRWHDVGTDNGLRLAIASGSFGFSGSMDKHLGSRHPLHGFRAGFLVEQNAHQGTRPQGAFGSDVQSNMVFISHERIWPVAHKGWVLHSRLLLGNSAPDYQESAMFTASRSWYSSAALTFQYTGKDSHTGLAIEQPLRAESGQGTLSYPYGRTPTGARLYQSHRFTLEPEARAIYLGVSHDRTLAFGRLALELKYILNANHTAGEQDAWVRVAYKLAW